MSVQYLGVVAGSKLELSVLNLARGKKINLKRSLVKNHTAVGSRLREFEVEFTEPRARVLAHKNKP